MLQQTSLNQVHIECGGKMVDFAGWNMPLHYGSQIQEHHQVRRDAGLFDVSHMTILDVKGSDARNYLRYVLANDVDRLQTEGQALYGAMLNERGGVIDDLIVYRLVDGFRVVVNCATREKDLVWMKKHAESFDLSLLERADLSMIAIQGPSARHKAQHVLEESSSRLSELSPFHSTFVSWQDGEPAQVARTGYTGEDGYEIILPETNAVSLWRALHEAGAAPCGLAARDTLRLEAGLNLYGHEMDESVSPLVANMAWTIAWEPEREFIGRAVLQAEREQGVREKLVGLLLTNKGVLRSGQAVIFDGDPALRGVITSGTFSPTLGYSIALARVPREAQGAAQVEMRNRLLPVEITKPRFVRHGQSLV